MKPLSPSPELLLWMTDVLLLAAIIWLTLHILRERQGRRPGSNYGGAVVIGGILLTALGYAFHAVAPGAAAAGGVSGSPDWIVWGLSRAGLLMIAGGLFLADRHGRKTESDAHASSARQRAAEHQAVLSEERFRSLVETTSNAIYCYSFETPMSTDLAPEEQLARSLDAVVTECNGVFANAVGYEKSADVIGTRLSMLDRTKDRHAHARFFNDLIASDYQLKDYDYVFRDASGDDCALSISVTGIIKGGRLERLWCFERNIVHARRTQRELYRRRVFQEMLAGISSRLIVTRIEQVDEAMRLSLKEVCEFLGGNRIFLVWGDDEKRSGEILYAWQADNRPLIEEVRLEAFPYVGGKIISNEVVSVPDIHELPDEADAEKKILQAAGIKSFFVFPLVVDGEAVGFTGVANDESQCEWSPQDLLDMRVVAELFSGYLVRLRQQRALDAALESLQQATRRLEAENVYLRSEIAVKGEFQDIVGDSEVLRRCLQMVDAVADTTTPVLILGETGTGKELVAHALHERSRRRQRPLVKVNCAALPADLIESELFGYEKGAFTGAGAAKRGRFELAHGSTIFLDEIGETPIELQAKLLRVLQDGEFDRLGADATTKVDVRIVAATNRDLSQACKAGEFRQDLLYRINAFPIELPPLRERDGDIRLLARHFARKHARNLDREITAISANMVDQLESYDWPGNVRELEGVIQRALISTVGPVLELDHQLVRRSDASKGFDAAMASASLEQVERQHILATLEKARWKISGEDGAAASLGVPPSTLRSKMKKLGVVRPARSRQLLFPS